MVSFKNKNDVMTALIHLGYLAYNRDERAAYIPNEEIRSEFLDAVDATQWNEFLDYQKLSRAILAATLDMDAETVADLLEKVHQEYASVIQYNDENSLSSVLSIAYLSSMQYISSLLERCRWVEASQILCIFQSRYIRKITLRCWLS